MNEFDGFSKRLKYLLDKKNLKQVDLCKLTNISKNAMSNYINGRRIPDTLSTYKLGQSLEVSMEWLLTGKEPSFLSMDKQLDNINDKWYELNEINELVNSMLSLGKSLPEIKNELSIHNIDISYEMIDLMTDNTIAQIDSWQFRPIDKIYPIVYTETVKYKLKIDTGYLEQYIVILIGVTINGIRECLGLYSCSNLDEKEWLIILKDLKDRGLEEVFIFALENPKNLASITNNVFKNSKIIKNIIKSTLSMFSVVKENDQLVFSHQLQGIFLSSSIEKAKLQYDNLKRDWADYSIYLDFWLDDWNEMENIFKLEINTRIIILNYFLQSKNSKDFYSMLFHIEQKSDFYTSNKLALKHLFKAVTYLAQYWNEKPDIWSKVLEEFNAEYPNLVKKYILK